MSADGRRTETTEVTEEGAYGGQCRMDSMMVSMNNCTVTVSFSRLRFRSFFVIKLFSICWYTVTRTHTTKRVSDESLCRVFSDGPDVR